MRGLQPRPDWRTKATFEDIVAWAQSVAEGRWSWIRNSACKYVTLRMDTRSGAYRIEDRDGNELSIADLTRQYGSDSGSDPKGEDTGTVAECASIAERAEGIAMTNRIKHILLNFKDEDGFPLCDLLSDEDVDRLAEETAALNPKGASDT